MSCSFTASLSCDRSYNNNKRRPSEPLGNRDRRSSRIRHETTSSCILLPFIHLRSLLSSSVPFLVLFAPYVSDSLAERVSLIRWIQWNVYQHVIILCVALVEPLISELSLGSLSWDFLDQFRVFLLAVNVKKKVSIASRRMLFWSLWSLVLSST